RRSAATIHLLALLAAALVTSAQPRIAAAREPADTLPAGERKPPRYTVELIVFTYGDDASSGSEIFVPEPPPVGPYATPDERLPGNEEPAFGDLPPEPVAAPGADVPAPAEGAKDRPFRPGEAEEPEISGRDENLADIPLRARIELYRVPPERYSMKAIYDKLVRLDAYRPIMHTAWTQTTPPREASPAIRLRALGDPPPGLDGTVKLYQGRFVHLGIDLALDAESGIAVAQGTTGQRRATTDRATGGTTGHPAPGQAASGAADRRYEPYGPSGDFPALPVRYRISEVRIMNDGHIRYYDHPRFGVIAKLTKVVEDAPDAEGAVADRD
ncbi:MAG TPA: CsiV family protein, partial [Woeseiaceae bacterium]|nr:CsiV family protein [Woeseiaceae bacterium]